MRSRSHWDMGKTCNRVLQPRTFTVSSCAGNLTPSKVPAVKREMAVPDHHP
ncbi:MAG: hypothetical protein AVDCRST_MAG87-2042 [uncultured Thermomicrobiales bacterium]|uniref:Uncharacterized protein n=1 Tax=uncultured Thermomicrobiales bacterium TaxID=1645740 RepID=A0A6J4V6T9_9BACT|nr:MAG: hypothetical protein AVDCRST_MAG87-2042 [uncultured Thermomicrobiales bacterium]